MSARVPASGSLRSPESPGALFCLSVFLPHTLKLHALCCAQIKMDIFFSMRCFAHSVRVRSSSWTAGPIWTARGYRSQCILGAKCLDTLYHPTHCNPPPRFCERCGSCSVWDCCKHEFEIQLGHHLPCSDFRGLCSVILTYLMDAQDHLYHVLLKKT